MNSLNNSGMISAIQKPDGSPYDDSATPTPPQKRIVRSKSQTITPQQFPPNYIPSASLNQPRPSFSPYSQQSVMQAQPSAAFQNNPVKAKIQKLQEEWESDIQKAFRKQRLRFDNCALVEDFQSCLTYQCSNGENTIVKPFSPCRNLRAQKIIEHDTKKRIHQIYVRYSYRRTQKRHSRCYLQCPAPLQFATRQRIYCLRTSSSYRLWRADCPVYRSYTRFHSTTDKILSRMVFF